MCTVCYRTEGLCLCVRSDRLKPFSSDSQRQESDCIFTCSLLCCKCSFCYRFATKERRKSQLLSKLHRNKICERCFLCRSLEFCKFCHKCPNCCYRSTCRGKATQILGEVGSSGFESKSSNHTRRALHPSLPGKYMRFHLQGRSSQFKALPFGHSTAPMEFTVVAKEVKLMALQRGIRIHQYLDDWLVRATSLQTCLQHTQTLVRSLSRTRLAGEQGEVRTGSKTGFQLRRLPVRLERGQSQTHTRALADFDRQNSDNSVRSGVFGPAVHVPHRAPNSHRKASSPRSTSYETHTVALEEQLEGTRITRKGDTRYRSLHPHLRWWLEESNVLPGQPLHPLKHALQIFTDASKEGWGAHLNKRTARGT